MSDGLLEQLGFAVERIDDDKLVVRFPEIWDELRAPELDATFVDLLRVRTFAALDLSACEEIHSSWVVLIATETALAREQGRVIGIVGASDALRDLADMRGEADRLRYFDTIEEVWAA